MSRSHIGTPDGQIDETADFEYNQLGYMTKKTEDGKTLEYTYDQYGNITSMKDQLNLTRTYQRDISNRLTDIDVLRSFPKIQLQERLILSFINLYIIPIKQRYCSKRLDIVPIMGYNSIRLG